MYFKPKRIAITGGYHGCHASIDVYKRTRETELPLIGIDDEFQPGDLCWLETPLNPTGEARYVSLPSHSAITNVHLFAPVTSSTTLTRYDHQLRPWYVCS